MKDQLCLHNYRYILAALQLACCEYIRFFIKSWCLGKRLIVDMPDIFERRTLSLYDSEYATQYANVDSQLIGTEDFSFSCNFIRTAGNYSMQCPSRGGDKSNRRVAIDFGCGTGRYFECFERFSTLLACDISESMLAHARDKCEVLAGRYKLNVLLIRAGMELLDQLMPNSVNFVSSIGVLGEHYPLDVLFLKKVSRILVNGGVCAFTVVDADSIAKQNSMKRRLYERFSRSTGIRIDRFHCLHLQSTELASVVEHSGLDTVQSLSRFHHGHQWRGSHFFVILRKPG